MRRHEKEITDKSTMEAIIRKAVVCRLGVSVNNLPPVSSAMVCSAFRFSLLDKVILLVSEP